MSYKLLLILSKFYLEIDFNKINYIYKFVYILIFRFWQKNISDYFFVRQKKWIFTNLRSPSMAISFNTSHGPPVFLKYYRQEYVSPSTLSWEDEGTFVGT